MLFKLTFLLENISKPFWVNCSCFVANFSIYTERINGRCCWLGKKQCSYDKYGGKKEQLRKTHFLS